MSKVNIQPLNDNIIVRRLEAITESAGGIVLPGASEELPAEAIVLAVGKGKTLANGDIDTLDVKVNDRVIFGQKAGTEINIDGENLLALIEDEIIAILR